MNVPLRRSLIWTPRILGILFILFVSMFALDVFGANYVWWQKIAALFMHLLPSLVMLLALVLAWAKKWEWVGAIGFFGFALWYVAWYTGLNLGHLMNLVDLQIILMVAGIPALIGALFLIDWIYRKQLRG